MLSAILFASLIGPATDPPPAALRLTIHLGTDRRSEIIRSELRNPHQYFLAKRLKIQHRYDIRVDDDAYREPTYQIGRGGERLTFPRGAFNGSGCFLRTLEAITDRDQWEREYRGWQGVWMYGEFSYREIPEPDAFPELPVPVPAAVSADGATTGAADGWEGFP